MMKKDEEQLEMDLDMDLEGNQKIIDENSPKEDEEELMLVDSTVLPLEGFVSVSVGFHNLVLPFEYIGELVEKLLISQKEVAVLEARKEFVVSMLKENE